MIFRSFNPLYGIRLGVMIGLLALTYFWSALSVQDAFIQSHSLLVFDGPANEGRGPVDVDELNNYVLFGPLKQSRVNALLVQRVRSSTIEPDEFQSALVHLAALGWRHSASAVNLMGFYAYKRDAQRSLDRISSLLERNQTTSEALQFLTIAARDKDFRAVLVGRLGNSPTWRKDYFSFNVGEVNASDLAIKHGIVMKLLTMNANITREEIVPAVWGFFENDAKDEAFSVWTTWLAEKYQSSSTLSVYANEPSLFRADGSVRSPFEWMLESGDGYSVIVATDKSRPYFVVDWNGSGQPAFAQVNLGQSAADVALQLDFVEDPSGPKSSDWLNGSLSMYLVCRDQGELKLASRAVGAHSLKFYLPSGRVSSCSYPILQLRPNVRAAGVQQYWEISSIHAE